MRIALEIDDHLISDAVNKAINNKIKNSYDIECVITNAVTENIRQRFNKAENDGSIIQRVAAKIAEQISVSDILKLIDVDALQEKASERVAKNLLSKINKL